MVYTARSTERPPGYGVSEAAYNELNANQNYLNGRLSMQVPATMWLPVGTGAIPVHDALGLSWDGDYALDYPVATDLFVWASRRIVIPDRYIHTGAGIDSLSVNVDWYTAGTGRFRWALDVYISRTGESALSAPHLGSPVASNVINVATGNRNKKTATELIVYTDRLDAVVSSLMPDRIIPGDSLVLTLGKSVVGLGGNALNNVLRLLGATVVLGGYTTTGVPGRVALVGTRLSSTRMRITWTPPKLIDGSDDTTVTSYEYNIGGNWVSVGNVLTAVITVVGGTYQVYVRARNLFGTTYAPPSVSVQISSG